MNLEKRFTRNKSYWSQSISSPEVQKEQGEAEKSLETKDLSDRRREGTNQRESAPPGGVKTNRRGSDATGDEIIHIRLS